MNQGFLKVAAICPKIKVADPIYNAEVIIEQSLQAEKQGAKIMVFPELCLTGYTCGDLFFQDVLLKKTLQALNKIRIQTKKIDALIFIGLPLLHKGSLYDVAAVLNHGNVVGFVPKTNLIKYGEIQEQRYFVEGFSTREDYIWEKERIPFGRNLLFSFEELDGLFVGCEIGSDMDALCPPSQSHVAKGAQVIVNLSAQAEKIGSCEYYELLARATSARLSLGYILSGNGQGESTQDAVFGGRGLIVENGDVLCKAKPFSEEILIGDLDIQRLNIERIYKKTICDKNEELYAYIPFQLKMENVSLKREFSTMPFLSKEASKDSERYENILSIAAYGLKKRMEHTGLSKVVIGISGGLDSTLALLITVYAFDLLKMKRENIVAVTMPCFGTTEHTYQSSLDLIKSLQVNLKIINIEESVKVHFQAIDHPLSLQDLVYENAQARERTQVLMDLANKEQALVIGTGDLSELALGWATYNGDQMSMYGVNSDIPKTLVTKLVEYCAQYCHNPLLKKVLEKILCTPVSPELLPPENGIISQRTEELVGPYELHDFFLYYVLRWGFSPEKIYRLAKSSFKEYNDQVILKWLKTFYRRFFSQQFKRSCLPDGPKIGSVSLSPRGSYFMPSDASKEIWMSQLEKL